MSSDRDLSEFGVQNSALRAGAAFDPKPRISPDTKIFRQMADNIHEIFWTLDASTYEVIYVSPAFERICGLPCQSLYDAPTSYRGVIHPEDRKRVLGRLEELPENGKFDEEFRIVRPDGIVRCVHAGGFLARDCDGAVTRLVGTVHDITERRGPHGFWRPRSQESFGVAEKAVYAA